MRRASEAEQARLGETFADLCRIRSPFGHERACMDAIEADLRDMGVVATEDDAAGEAGAECGNVLARIDGASDRTILLCAHVDTVAAHAAIDPVIVDGGWENANDGILGADNKAAVAVILEVARRAVAEPAPVNLELLFTVSEENALAGAKAFDVGSLEADFGYVFDHATPIGGVIVASPTYFRIAAEFRGQSAHAGIRPEDGRSAIIAATHAIKRMPHGRLDAETTANVGYISAGIPNATNVVPERCSVLAETRSLDGQRAEDVVAAMVDALHDGAAHAECDVDVVVEKLFEGYRLRPSEPAVVAAEAALRACGYDPQRVATGGGADANAFVKEGLVCVNLANGTERNHQPDERVSVAALNGMLDVTFALLEACAA
ncbi:MAG: tripeptide aminopeptidase [Solirubrobacteraceae bacterium]|nr:tripeptide aminopeptidase [Solirubrobacteraceae bacterium]